MAPEGEVNGDARARLQEARTPFLVRHRRDLLVVALSFVANVYILIQVDGRPRVFLCSFLLAAILRYTALWSLLKIHAGWPSPRLTRFFYVFVRHPDEGGAYTCGGAQTPIYGHILFVLLFGAAPLALLHFTAPDQGDLRWDALRKDGVWILGAFGVYTMKDLLMKGLIVDFNATQEQNAGYNFMAGLSLIVAIILASLGAFILAPLAVLFPVAIERFVPWFLALVLLLAIHFMDLAIRIGDPVFTKPSR